MKSPLSKTGPATSRHAYTPWLAFLTSVLIGAPLHGAEYRWSGGGDENFSNAQNWEQGTAPAPGTANDYFFTGNQQLSPFLNSVGSVNTWNFKSITFEEGAGAFNIRGDGQNTTHRFLGSNVTIQQNSAANQRISATLVLSGQSRITGSGSGSLTLDSIRFGSTSTARILLERSATIGEISSVSSSATSELQITNPSTVSFSDTTTGSLSAIEIKTASGASGTTLRATNAAGLTSSAALSSNASFTFGGTQAMHFTGNVTMLGSVGNKTITFSNTGGTTLSGETLQLGAEDGSASRNIIMGVATNALATISGNLKSDASTGETGLEKTGAGTLILSGENSYNGGTTVTAGTLLINNTSGSGTGSGAVVVNGGVLGGTGTIAPDGHDITIAGGALAVGDLHDAEGDGISTLTLAQAGGAANLALTTAATVHLDIWSAAAYEQLVFELGSITLGGAKLVVSSQFDAWAMDDTFTLFDWGESTLNGTFAELLLPTLGHGLAWDTSRLYTDGVVTVIPEPGTLTLLGGALAGIALFQYRRIRR